MVIINKGEKIAQGIFEKYFITDDDSPNKQIRKGGLEVVTNKIKKVLK